MDIEPEPLDNNSNHTAPDMTNPDTSTSILFDEARDRRLADIFSAGLTVILELRARSDYGDPESLRKRFLEVLAKAERDASKIGVSSEEIGLARFAVVAFMDETILSSDWARKDAWLAKPLQMELFDLYDAGEEFFIRLEGIRKSLPARAEVLEVYYMCMALGFKGKYQIYGQEELRLLIEQTHEELSRVPGMAGKRLSPHGKPRDQVATEFRSKLPTWVIVVAVLSLGLIIYAAMSVYISNAARETTREIQEVSRMESFS